MTGDKIKTFVGKKTRWFCNRCRTRTNHTCKAEHFPTEEGEPFVEQDGTKYWGIEHFYRLWVCDGCEDAVLEQAWDGCKIADAAGDQWYSDTELQIELHPHRTEESVPVRDYKGLPPSVAGVYYETVFAHHHCLHLLCALGLRSLVEAICIDQRITGRNLEQKIDGLTKLLPPTTAAKFHTLRFIGNEAAHEFKEPNAADLRLGIEVCEDMLSFLYELDAKLTKLASKSRRASSSDKV